MNPSVDNKLDELLDSHIEASREVNEAQLEQATTQFRESLPEAKPEPRSLFSWVRMAGAVAALVLVVSLAPLLLPGKPGANAFAQAQEWFERYDTMNFLMTISQKDRVVSTVEVWTDADGNTRVDTPPVRIIVLPTENLMHTVMPGDEVITQSLGMNAGTFDLSQEMEWLGELLEFQGLADLLEETRVVQGVDAFGWQLSLSGGTHTLWVDPADNRPLLLEASLPGGIFMESVFVFDEELPGNVFEVPGIR